jgi:diguanylate cyclase (GGDEF)-like protein
VRLNSKIALVLVLPMLILSAVLAWAIYSQVLNRFVALEQAQQQQNHQRLFEAINAELDTLSRLGRDYSAWDDTYRYMQDHNSAFVAANLTPETLINLHLDGILLFDQQQQLQAQLSLDSTSHKPIKTSSALRQGIAANLASQPADARQQGILTIQGRTLMLVSSPITDSNAVHASVGTLVIFRDVDQDAVHGLGKQIKLNLQFSALQGPGSETIEPQVLTALSHQALWLRSDDEYTASSYSLLNDLNGSPALLMHVSMPRDTYREGLATARTLLGFTLIALLLFGGATFAALHAVALKRLSQLSRGLIGIGAQGGNRQRLPVHGSDEIAQVARSVNAMLDQLEQHFEQRRSAGERQRELNALLVQIATDDAVAHGDTAALFRVMAGSLTAGTSMDAWSLWLSSEDGQSFDCLRSSSVSPIGMCPEQLKQALTERSAGLPSLLTCQFQSPQHHGLILPFHVDSHLGAVCVEAHNSEALSASEELNFLIAATQLIERSLRTHFQNLREHDLRLRAEKDPLTGLANRSLFEIELMRRLKNVHSSGPLLGLLFIDLDRFKPINDTYGHAVGDWLLCQVAQRLREQVRAEDLVARLGGDEFTIILNSLHAQEDAERITEKVLQALNQPFMHEQTRLDCSASIGLAWAPAHGDSVAELVKAADLAMYAAKRLGRSNWHQAPLPAASSVDQPSAE